MFNSEQTKLLSAPLSAANVKTRSQSGRNFSYVESWKVIEEANRIFGFDGWASETVEIKCVSEREREIGTTKKAGWGVSYIARVRISIGELVRDGVGAGHGIDVDLGQAHESAIKEAESDARKRALMTFGYPFGLALYDKNHKHVDHGEADELKPAPPRQEYQSKVLPEPLATQSLAKLQSEMNGCVNVEELDKFVRSPSYTDRVSVLPPKHRETLRIHGQARLAALKTRAA